MNLPIKLKKLLFEAFKKNLDLIKGIPTVSLQQVHEKKLFGPVYHGTTPEKMKHILEKGFTFYTTTKDMNAEVRNGYPWLAYYQGIPPPIHHLGFGVYFTTSKAIAQRFNLGSGAGLYEFYLDIPNMETINFGANKTMMQWWIANGYDKDLALNSSALAEGNRVKATQLLTQNLSSKYDAVWFKGKGIKRLLDGDQICVYDTSRIYVLDKRKSNINKGEIGSKVRLLNQEKEMVGIYMGKREEIPAGYLENLKKLDLNQVEAEKGKQYRQRIENILNGDGYYHVVLLQKGGKNPNLSSLDFEFI